MFDKEHSDMVFNDVGGRLNVDLLHFVDGFEEVLLGGKELVAEEKENQKADDLNKGPVVENGGGKFVEHCILLCCCLPT